MNKVILMGRPTRDPEIRYSQGENAMAIARFNLAVNRRFRSENNDQTADFIRCIAFGKTAEAIEQYIRQGTKILVEGRIQTGNYTNKEGDKIYTTDVVVESLEFAEKKSDAEGQNNRPEPKNKEDLMSISDDDFAGLPFN